MRKLIFVTWLKKIIVRAGRPINFFLSWSQGRQKNQELVDVTVQESHLRSQYDWNHMRTCDLIILLFKEKIYEHIY